MKTSTRITPGFEEPVRNPGHTTVLDNEGLARLFQWLAGRTLIGAVDGIGCVELVFSDSEGVGGNLVTIFTEGSNRGRVAHGFVSQDLIDGGYGSK